MMKPWRTKCVDWDSRSEWSIAYRMLTRSRRLYSNRMNTNSFVRDTSVSNKHSRSPTERGSTTNIWRPSIERTRSVLLKCRAERTYSIVIGCWRICVRFFVDRSVLRNDAEPSLVRWSLERIDESFQYEWHALLVSLELWALSIVRSQCPRRHWCEPWCSLRCRTRRAGRWSFGIYWRTHFEPRDPREIFVFARIEYLKSRERRRSAVRSITHHS